MQPPRPSSFAKRQWQQMPRALPPPSATAAEPTSIGARLQASEDSWRRALDTVRLSSRIPAYFPNILPVAAAARPRPKPRTSGDGLVAFQYRIRRH